MASTNYVCGTGTWTGPKPGDPDNNLILSATPAFGGIDVSWSYPATNPYAVAHTVLYRGLSQNYAGAIQHAVVSGNQYYDKSAGDVPVEYFYWIQVVSVNGTYGELIGPASAIARPTIEETLRQLTGKIDQGVLAQSLRSEIERISQLDTNLGKEVLNRINANETLSAVLSAVQTEVGEAITLLENEVIERSGADAALLTSINTLATGLNSNAAAIVEERTARTSAIDALAADIVTLYTKYAENTAAISAESQARADQFTAFTTTVESMVAAVGDASDAAIQAESTARADQYSSLTQQITTLQSTLQGGYSAAIQTEADARVAADEALATLITTAESVIGDNIASVQTALQTNINAVGDKVSDIGALYTAKVNVNGLIGGFGIYNDGTEVEAGFDVDRFWVGRTGQNSIKPFIVENGEVFINKAVIQTLTADMIDTRGLTIKDPVTGEVLFGAGTAVDFETGVGGPGKPQAGATRNVFKGDWASGTLYDVGDIVIDDVGYGWSSLVKHTSGNLSKPPKYPENSSNGFWTIYAIKGEDAVLGRLTNESATIPATFDGTVTPDSLLAASGTFEVYKGVNLIAPADVVFSVVSAVGCVGSIDAQGNYSVTAMDADSATLTLRAVYGVTSQDCVLTLSKSKAGSHAVAYWLNSSSVAIVRDAAGNYVEPSVTFSAMAQWGDQEPAPYVGRFIIETTSDGVNFANRYVSLVDESSVTFTLPSGIKSIKARLYQDGLTDLTEFLVALDEATVVIVDDGVEYDVKIESTNGTIFRVGQSKQTTLIARVFRNGVDVTDQLSPSVFRWRRVSMNPQEPPNNDATWDALYQAGYKQITVSVDDIYAKATFHCQIIQ